MTHHPPLYSTRRTRHKGKNLHIDTVSVETGDMRVSGDIWSLQYGDKDRKGALSALGSCSADVWNSRYLFHRTGTNHAFPLCLPAGAANGLAVRLVPDAAGIVSPCDRGRCHRRHSFLLHLCGYARCIHFRCLSRRVSPLLSGRYAPRLPALAVHSRQFPAENYPKNCRFSPPFFITDIPSGCGIFCTNTMGNQAKISSCYTKSQKKEKKCPHSLDCRPPFVV